MTHSWQTVLGSVRRLGSEGGLARGRRARTQPCARTLVLCTQARPGLCVASWHPGAHTLYSARSLPDPYHSKPRAAPCATRRPARVPRGHSATRGFANGRSVRVRLVNSRSQGRFLRSAWSIISTEVRQLTSLRAYRQAHGGTREAVGNLILTCVSVATGRARVLASPGARPHVASRCCDMGWHIVVT